MLLVLFFILLLLAFGGGILINPWLFLLLVLAVFALYGDRRGTW